MKPKKEYAPKQETKRESKPSKGTHPFNRNPLVSNHLGRHPFEHNPLAYNGGGTFAPHPTSQLREQEKPSTQSAPVQAQSKSQEKVGNFTAVAQREADPNRPDLETYKGQDLNLQGRISSNSGNYADAVASGMNLRAQPSPGLDPIAKLKYNSLVTVRANNAGGGWYFVVAQDGTAGWVNQAFVAVNPPDTGSVLHHVTEPDLTTIMQQHYTGKNDIGLKTGNDFTGLSVAIAHANQGRSGIYLNQSKLAQYKKENAVRERFDPAANNFSNYAAVEIVAGSNIWLPSPSYLKALQETGAVATRAEWLNKVSDVGDMLTGFNAGLAEGIFGSIWDTLTGLYDLGGQLIGTIKKLFTGELFAEIGAIFSEVKQKFEELAAMSTAELMAYGESLWNMFTTSVSGAVGDFVSMWTHPNTWKRWHYRGKIVGQIVLEVALAIFTAGAGNAVKWLGVIGKFSPKLMRIIQKALKTADAMVPDFSKRKGRNGKRDGSNRNEKGSQNGNRDGSNRDERGSRDDDGFRNALLMARMVTEGHDAQDSPIPVLEASLAAVKAQFSGSVRGYDIEPKAEPGHYTVTQLQKKKGNVSQDYENKDGGKQAPRKLTKALWGKKNEYTSGVQTAMEHIAEGHFHNSRPGKKSSRFYLEFCNPHQIKRLVNEAVAIGKHSGKPGNYSVIHQFDYFIGASLENKKTRSIKVHLDSDGHVLTAYPY